MTLATLRRKLKALGQTREEVFQSLRRLGVKGDPGNPEECAVAEYMRHCGSGRVCVSCGEGLISTSLGTIKKRTVPAVFAFADRFDAGAYPELEKQEIPV